MDRAMKLEILRRVEEMSSSDDIGEGSEGSDIESVDSFRPTGLKVVDGEKSSDEEPDTVKVSVHHFIS